MRYAHAVGRNGAGGTPALALMPCPHQAAGKAQAAPLPRGRETSEALLGGGCGPARAMAAQRRGAGRHETEEPQAATPVDVQQHLGRRGARTYAGRDRGAGAGI